MLKSLIYITLAMTMVLNSMVYSLIKVDFTINRKYIIENFCINKDKPELKCDGKCFLAEKIKAEKERQESLPAFTFNKDFGVFVPSESIANSIELTFEAFLTHQETYHNEFSQTAAFSIDHPPQS